MSIICCTSIPVNVYTLSYSHVFVVLHFLAILLTSNTKSAIKPYGGCLQSKGSDFVVWNCGTLLPIPPPQSEKASHFCDGFDNKVSQLHATVSEPFN